MKKSLNKIIEDIIKEFEDKEKIRDKCLKLVREIIKLSAEGIREIHKNNIKNAERLINRAERKLKKINNQLYEFKDLYYSNLLIDAQKEYAEMIILYHIILNKPLPLPKKVNVEKVAYIKGLSEVIGELRRYILELLKNEKYRKAEELFDIMEEIYYKLFSLNFSDSITGGLRRLVDTNRVTVEKTHSDLIYAQMKAS